MQGNNKDEKIKLDILAVCDCFIIIIIASKEADKVKKGKERKGRDKTQNAWLLDLSYLVLACYLSTLRYFSLNFSVFQGFH